MHDVFLKIDTLSYYRDIAKNIPLGKPIFNYHVSSTFGHRSDPFNSKSAAHKGVDLASNRGNIIKVMADGKVTRSEWMNGYGNMLEIDHGYGFKTKYAHLNKSYVKKGQTVLLSPASSSFDAFSGYEERGEAFVALVKELQEKERVKALKESVEENEEGRKDIEFVGIGGEENE